MIHDTGCDNNRQKVFRALAAPTSRRPPRGLRAEAERMRIKKGHPREMPIVPLIAIPIIRWPCNIYWQSYFCSLYRYRASRSS